MLKPLKAQVLKSCTFAVACVMLSACAPIITVHEVRPKAPAQISPPRDAVTACFADARRNAAHNPNRAIADYLQASQLARSQFAKSHDSLTTNRALTKYRLAVDRVLSLLNRTKPPIAGRTLVFANGERKFFLRVNAPPALALRLQSARWIPADSLAIGGTAFPKRATAAGAGAPMVALFPETKERPRVFDLAKDYGNFTAIIDGKDGKNGALTLTFKRPAETKSVVLGGRRWSLAADYSAPMALAMIRERPQAFGLLRLLRPEKYDNTTRLYLLQHFDAKRTPVVLVHGLQDSPAAWTKTVNALEADPAIRAHFQFWVFSYPSGYPFQYSAMKFERCLDLADAKFPHHRKYVLIGHSMGGLIVRLQVTNTGLALWNAVFRKPPSKITVSEKNRELIYGSLIFKARHDVRNVIFISTPHRGSTFAVNWIGRIGSALVKLPLNFIKLGASLQSALIPGSGEQLARVPNSIDTLSPNNPGLKALAKLPVAVPFDSIMGDRGRIGDVRKSSDGIVPYWSSHLAGARSETFVPSGHDAQLNPQAIRKVKQILLSEDR